MEQANATILCYQDSLTYKISDRVGLRVYTDTRPHCLEIAALHKGIILLLDNVELIEEGAGFGVPIVKYKKTYFPGDAQCRVEKTSQGFSVIKAFELNLISRKRIGKYTYLNDTLYKFFRTQFERIYLRKDSANSLLNKLMEFRKYVGIETEFVKVQSKGKVNVTYHFTEEAIHIEADLEGLEKQGCHEILLLNEQGASFFPKYSDASGLVQLENKIRGWKIVNAKIAQLSDSDEKLKFILNQQKGAKLFRGREKTRNRFSWTGLNYSLNPKKTSFCYTIKIEYTKSVKTSNGTPKNLYP